MIHDVLGRAMCRSRPVRGVESGASRRACRPPSAPSSALGRDARYDAHDPAPGSRDSPRHCRAAANVFKAKRNWARPEGRYPRRHRVFAMCATQFGRPTRRTEGSRAKGAERSTVTSAPMSGRLTANMEQCVARCFAAAVLARRSCPADGSSNAGLDRAPVRGAHVQPARPGASSTRSPIGDHVRRRGLIGEPHIRIADVSSPKLGFPERTHRRMRASHAGGCATVGRRSWRRSRAVGRSPPASPRA